jgi:ribosome biogenesis GTPase
MGDSAPVATPATPSTLEDFGWDERWAAAFLPFNATGRRPARVSAAHRDAWVVALPGTGDRDAVIAGRLRIEALGPANLPAVGDWVAVAPGDGAATGPAVISAVLPRRSMFGRSNGDASRRDGARTKDEQVLAANVDVAFVVTGLDGDFNLRRLERYLAVAWSGGATPVILLNKADLAADPAGYQVAAAAVAPGVDIRSISALTGDGVADLVTHHLAPGRTAVVLGSSGAGKSTLVNALLGREHLRTAAVREDDARGRHTTTHRELVRLPGGALLIDTPGIRSLGVTGAADGMDAAFADIAELAEDCRFRDCRHDGEPGCAVTAAVADGTLDPRRLQSHRQLEREAAHHARAADPLLRAAERSRWKAIHASVAIHMRHKYGDDQ